MYGTYETELSNPGRWLHVVVDECGDVTVRTASKLTARTLRPDWRNRSNPQRTAALLREAILQRLGAFSGSKFFSLNWRRGKAEWRSMRFYVYADGRLDAEIYAERRWIALPQSDHVRFLGAALMRVDYELNERASSARLIRTMTPEQWEHPAVTAGGI